MPQRKKFYTSRKHKKRLYIQKVKSQGMKFFGNRFSIKNAYCLDFRIKSGMFRYISCFKNYKIILILFWGKPVYVKCDENNNIVEILNFEAKIRGIKKRA